MTRLSLLAVALVLAVPTTVATAATYVGTPAAPTTAAKLIARDLVWTKVAGSYRGITAESRPIVLCQGLAKRAGPLASFAVDGKAFDAAELAKCNRLPAPASAVVQSAGQ